MKPLKIGITGVRGIVGESFTPELVVEFAQEMLAKIKEAKRVGGGPKLERTTHILRGAAGKFGATGRGSCA
jgi:hypothetical protein